MISIVLFPELSRLASRREQKEVFKLACRELQHRAAYWWFCAMVIVGHVICIFSLPYLGVPMSQRGFIRGVSLGVTMLIVSISALFFRKTLRRSIRRQLVYRGYACCLTCGYDLTGNTSGRCPECGAEFV